MLRNAALDRLVDRIESPRLAHPIRVALDGVDAAGKTVLADELADRIRTRGRTVIRASVDGFHRPRAERYQRGSDSPEGYYLDSFNHQALRELLLEPLGPNGNRKYRKRQFDFRQDSTTQKEILEAPDDAILLFDGVFLQRPELVDFWDLRIFVEASFNVTLARARKRDQALFGSEEAVVERYQRRYIPGQQLYLEQVRPWERADFVFRNDDISHPDLIESGG